MRREIQKDAIVELFKNELRNMDFINSNDYKKIDSWLDQLCEDLTRQEKALISSNIWKFFIDKSLKAITNNLRGYNELCHYFDDFVDYENLLFSIDRNYRDHTIHSIWVMLLGFFLKHNFELFKNIKGYSVIDYTETGEKNLSKTIEEIQKLENPLWCLIALTHDLGYPIKKTKNANSEMTKMINHFGFLKQHDFDYNFTIVHKTAIDELLNIISSKVVWVSKGGWNVFNSPGVRLDYAKSFEQLDHGIMSAYLLQNYLDFICDTFNLLESPSKYVFKNHKDAAQVAIVTDLLYAISSHTNKNTYTHTNYLNSMATLLFLCDELEEFSRYSCSIKTKNWEDVNCRTELSITKKSLQINYTFDNKDINYDIDSFFYDKIIKIHNRFELDQEGITNILITCRDVTKAKPVVYKYNRTHSKTEVKIAGKICNNILGLSI